MMKQTKRTKECTIWAMVMVMLINKCVGFRERKLSVVVIVAEQVVHVWICLSVCVCQ